MRRVAVVTVSDGVTQGTRIDKSGPALVSRLQELGYATSLTVVSDEREQIAAVLRRLAGEPGTAAVLTTGGTGLAPRDVTPEATREVITLEVPGLAEEIRRYGLQAGVRTALLSRGIAGTCGAVLIVNLPGSTRGAVDSLNAIMDVLPHAFDLLQGNTQHRPDPKLGITG